MKSIERFIRLFTTREIATIIWIIIFLIYVMSHKEVRKSFKSVIKTLLCKKLLMFWLFIIFYTGILTYFVSLLSIWKWEYLKDVILWLITCGFITCGNALSKEADEFYIKSILKDNLKIFLIIEFFFSTFTFSLIIELIIIPIITIISLLDVYTKNNEADKQVNKFLSILLSIIGFILLYKTVRVAIKTYEKLHYIDLIVSFIIPIVYLILFIPLIYLFELISKYEELFVRLSFRENKDKKNKIKHRLLIINTCKLSIKKLLLFRKSCFFNINPNMTEDEYKHLIINFKNEKFKRKKESS